MMKLKFDQSIFLGGKGSPFLKFVVSIWGGPVGGGLTRAWMARSTFVPRPNEHFLVLGGGACFRGGGPMKTTHLKKGLLKLEGNPLFSPRHFACTMLVCFSIQRLNISKED